MSTAAFIIGMVILGLCVVVAALMLSGAINGAATALKESAPQSLQQPTLSFLTEYDAADYLGISLNELDYIRSDGLLDGAFIAVTSLEQTGEETYYDYEDGVEVAKTRPVMSNVTRFLFNRQLLDEKMMEAIKNGSHINPFRTKAQEKKQSGKKNKHGSDGEKNGSSKKESTKHPVVQIYGDDDSSEPAEEVKTKAETKDTVKETPAEDTTPKASKPAAAGPPKPMGPIGDDEDNASDDDVIDIMARINSAKQNGGHSNNHGKNGGHNNGNRSGNQNRGGNPNRNNH